MIGRGLVFLSLFLLPLGPALAVDPARDRIDFGGVRLSLGMTQEQVFTLLGDGYRVEPAPEFPKQRPGLWWVYSKREPSVGTVGTLYLPDGRLAQATLDWDLEEPSARAAVDTLRAVFKAMNQSVPDSNPRQCLISLTRLPEPQSEVIGMAIRCGGKIVNLNVATDQGAAPSVHISEALDEGPGGLKTRSAP